MERSLTRVISPPRHTTVVGLGACALGLAAAGLFAAPGGAAGWSSVVLVGSSLLTAAAAGFATHPLRGSTTEETDVLAQRDVAELIGESGDGVWDYDLRSGNLVYDTACATMLGYDEGEITSTLSQWGTLVHKDDLPRARKALDDYLEGRTDHYRVHVRLRRKEGGWAHVVDCGRIVARDKDGRPQRAFGIHREVQAGVDGRDVALAVSSDLDKALAGLLGQATLASSSGGGTELERAAWRCVGLANRLKAATLDGDEAATETEVVTVARDIVRDVEQWTPNRVLLRVRNGAGVGTELIPEGVFQSLIQLGVDDAVDRVERDGGSVEVWLGREPNLVVRISTTPPSPRRGDETARMEALRGLADRHDIELSTQDGALHLAWPDRP
ncbi:MAG: PAS domain-containing protein [Nannocystales bacterium]